MNKKGVSEVITTILIIFISVTVVAIAGYFIRARLVEQPLQQIGTQQQCSNLVLKIDSVSWDGATVSVKVKRDANMGETNLTDLDIVVEGSVYKVSELPDTVPDELGWKVYSIAANTKPTEVSIAGILSNNAVCPTADTASGAKITG